MNDIMEYRATQERELNTNFVVKILFELWIYMINFRSYKYIEY